MASMKAIKTRIKSVESTRQITKAMELVATSKLRRAKERAERTRPYHEVLAQAISGLQAALPDKPSPFTQQRPVQKPCNVIIGGAGDACLEVLAAKGLLADVLQIGIPDRFIQQGDNLHLYQECGMDEESILNKIEERLKRVE